MRIYLHRLTAKGIFVALSLASLPLASTGFTAVPPRHDAPANQSRGGNRAALMTASLAFLPASNFAVDDGSVGYESISRVTIVNNGTEEIILSAPQLLQGANASVRFAMTSPVNLEPSDSLMVTIYVTPQQAGAINATVRMISSSTSYSPIDLPIYGSIPAIE